MKEGASLPAPRIMTLRGWFVEQTVSFLIEGLLRMEERF